MSRLIVGSALVRCHTPCICARLPNHSVLRRISHSSPTDVSALLRDIVKSAICEPFGASLCDSAKLDVIPTQNAKFGDYQSNVAFSLATSLRKPPREIANVIVNAIQYGDMIESASVAGGGFINITFVL